MSKTDQKRTALINKLVRFAQQNSPKKQKELFEKFLRRYYHNFPLDELKSRSTAELLAIATQHWELINQRKRHQPLLTAFNPSIEKHGWKSPHSFVQIVTDDMPFIVDSIRMELTRLGFTTFVFINVAGVEVERKANGEIKIFNPLTTEQTSTQNIEAYLSLEISCEADKNKLKGLLAALQNVLKDIQLAVVDWRKMQDQMREGIDELQRLPNEVFAVEEKDETYAFLQWLLEYFTFLGHREYVVQGEGKRKALVLVKDSGLGVLRDSAHSKTKRYYAELPPQVQDFMASKQVLWITKTNTRSTVHRPTYTDCIGFQRYNAQGELIGERRFVGLFTSDAYDSDPSRIPFLRKKVSTILSRSGLSLNGYGSKRLLHILKTLPRDDLMQASVDELYDLASGIADIQERPVVRLFVRPDMFNRFVSCLVYVPRDNFHTDLRIQMQAILMEAFGGTEAQATPTYSESLLACVHYVIRIDQHVPLNVDIEALEERLQAAAQSWKDRLRECIISRYAEDLGGRYFERYRKAFSEGYKEQYAPEIAAEDITYIEKLGPTHDLEMQLYHDNTGPAGQLRLRLFQAYQPIPLSDALPMLENMGLRALKERGYRVNLPSGGMAWISDFVLEFGLQSEMAMDIDSDAFKSSFDKIWHQAGEDDAFNSLMLSAGLDWRQINVLRAYARHMRQTGFNLSERYIQETLIKHADVVQEIVRLFECRFNPELSKNREQKLQRIESRLLDMLENIVVLDEDRILRRYYQTIKATMRTNYYQLAQGKPKEYLAFKFESRLIPDIPQPAPLYEAFIYSPRVEGVHLRYERVSRGGIRWSDRREDFRTEVLGLMKAQQVKNAVIVPGGAKGGFVPKQLPEQGARDDIQLEAIGCYQNFINGLLDVTDNLVNNKIVSPANTVRHDDDDPYLVVAADKGTATFSDIANRIASDRNFWLDDAFASGGSAGYDHKKMGITARGAWESVKHHFAAMEMDVDKDPFTVVGIGDMAGDVFGNGMLLSDKIKLVAAFNHLHIFIDPSPNMAKSYKERKRLFETPGSSWADYKRALISRGGGIFARSQKWIKITPQMQALFGISADRLSPNDLIHALLKAKVDLLWNGGIGTYIKASSESHADAGDRANDNLRVNGDELGARVFGEGGNLGATQLGRIEYALSGGRVNTDFIDNSAGVDCSDHEVNIKILLNDVMKAHDMTIQQRNQLLAKMTGNVGELVLENNKKQNLAITLASIQLPRGLHLYERFMQVNSLLGNIDRRLEFLPDAKLLHHRQDDGKSLTRPELSVLVSYSKIILKAEILETNLPEDKAFAEYVLPVFPSVLQKRYAKEINRHFLKREIIATQLSNQLVNELGLVFVQQLKDELKATTREIACAYVASRHIFRISSLQADLARYQAALPNAVHNNIQVLIQILHRRACRWLVRTYRGSLDVAQVNKNFSHAIDQLLPTVAKLVTGTDLQAYESLLAELTQYDLPSKVAQQFASLEIAYPIMNVIQAGLENKVDPQQLSTTYFILADKLSLIWLRRTITEHHAESHMHMLSRAMQKTELDKQQQRLTTLVHQFIKSNKKLGTLKPGQQVDAWIEHHQSSIDNWLSTLKEVELSGIMDFTVFSVLIGDLAELGTIAED